MDPETTQQAISFYRENFQQTGMFENTIYKGIPELLAALKKQHKTIILATSKPTVFAERILEFFNIESYFDEVVGSHLDGTRVDKADILSHILTLYPNVKKQSCIMIGDRKFDTIGAKEVGIDCIGVTYGYGGVEELQQTGPTYIVHSVEELTQLICHEAHAI